MPCCSFTVGRLSPAARGLSGATFMMSSAESKRVSAMARVGDEVEEQALGTCVRHNATLAWTPFNLGSQSIHTFHTAC
jgi:hypothetical protein